MSDDIPPTSGIYKITCTATGKIYIGSSVNMHKRCNEHSRLLRKNEHQNPKLQRAWNKYGADAFTFEVLELVLEINRTAREQYWFTKLKPFGNKGFNISHDATTPEHTPETTRKMIETRKWYKHSEETRRKIGEVAKGRPSPMKGKTHTAEARQKLSIAGKGRTPHNKGKKGQQVAWNKGIPPSEEELERLRKMGYQKGNQPTFSEEHRRKLREARAKQVMPTGYKRPPEVVKKVAEARARSGYRPSEATRQIWRETRRGKPWSEKRRATEKRKAELRGKSTELQFPETFFE